MNEIELLLSEDLESNYVRLGELYVNEKDISQFDPLTPRDLSELGKKYFFKLSKKITEAICNNKKIKKYVNKEESIDNIELIALIVEILGTGSLS